MQKKREAVILGVIIVTCIVVFLAILGITAYRTYDLHSSVDRLAKQDVSLRGTLSGMTIINTLQTMSPTYGYFSKSAGGGSQAIQSMAVREAYFAGCFRQNRADDASDCVGKSIVMATYGYIPEDGRGVAECNTAFAVPKMAQLCADTIKKHNQGSSMH